MINETFPKGYPHCVRCRKVLEDCGCAGWQGKYYPEVGEQPPGAPAGVGPPGAVPLLDHGYLALIESWGSDEAIIEAARMSTGKGFLGWDPGPCPTCHGEGFLEATHVTRCSTCNGKGSHAGDAKLLRYLWEHKHATPFEMAGLTIEVQAPIFVFREWHRHRVPFGYNEMSARYTPLPDLNYIPTVERLMINAGGSNRQAGTVDGAEPLTVERAQMFRDDLAGHYDRCEVMYQDALRSGVPKELARVHLPVGRYSRMRATGNLRGWLGFLTLRTAPDAQWEIRSYADAVAGLVAHAFPRTYALWSMP